MSSLAVSESVSAPALPSNSYVKLPEGRIPSPGACEILEFERSPPDLRPPETCLPEEAEPKIPLKRQENIGKVPMALPSLPSFYITDDKRPKVTAVAIIDPKLDQVEEIP